MSRRPVFESFYDIVGVLHDRVFIIDLNLPGTRSITNNADEIYWNIQKLWPKKRLIYRDTMGRWDEIKELFYKKDNGADVHITQIVPYKEELPDL